MESEARGGSGDPGPGPHLVPTPVRYKYVIKLTHLSSSYLRNCQCIATVIDDWTAYLCSGRCFNTFHGGGGVPDTCRPAAFRNCLATHVRYPRSVRERQPYRRHQLAKHLRLAPPQAREPPGAAASLPTAPANRTSQLSPPQRWPIDVFSGYSAPGRATATMGHRCCGNRIHGPSLRSAAPAEQHRCPTDAAAARARPAELHATRGLSSAAGRRSPEGPRRANCRSCPGGVHVGRRGAGSADADVVGQAG